MINHLITQKNWQTQLSEAVTSVDELLTMLNLEFLKPQVYIPEHFELRVPRGFVAKDEGWGRRGSVTKASLT